MTPLDKAWNLANIYPVKRAYHALFVNPTPCIPDDSVNAITNTAVPNPPLFQLCIAHSFTLALDNAVQKAGSVVGNRRRNVVRSGDRPAKRQPLSVSLFGLTGPRGLPPTTT